MTLTYPVFQSCIETSDNPAKNPPAYGGVGQSGVIMVPYVDSDVAVKAINPDYRAQKAAGEILPVMPYERTIKKGSMRIDVVGHATIKVTDIYPPYPVTTLRDSSRTTRYLTLPNDTYFDTLYASQRGVAINEAKAHFINHLDNMIVSAPENLGEMKETAGMMKNTMESMLKLAFDFKRTSSSLRRSARNILTGRYHAGQVHKNSNVSRLKKIANSLNSMYLEYNYGWKPLYMTFQDIVLLHTKLAEHYSGPKRIVGKGKFLIEESYDRSYVGFYKSPYFTYLGKIYFMEHQKYDYQVWVGGTMKPEFAVDRQSLESMTGWNARSIAPTLWELTTLSFIVDYFTNMGDVINNLKFLPQTMYPQSLYMSELTRFTAWPVGSIVPIAPQPRVSVNASVTMSAPSVYQMTHFKRTPLAAPDMLVSFNFKDPSMDHVVKTLSVAAQLTKLFK